jgi:hypothetical protein
VSTADWFVLLGSIFGYLLMMGVHEARAVRREDRAVWRHEAAIKAINDNRNIALGDRADRQALDRRTDWLEAAVADHAVHLEQLGRPGAMKVPPSKR